MQNDEITLSEAKRVTAELKASILNPDYAIGKFDLNKHTIKSKFKHYFKGSPNG